MSLPNSEPVYNLLDSSGNGLIDGIELFTILAILSESRFEDRFRFLFEIFDMNQRGYLEEVELQFLMFTVLSALVKVYEIGSESPEIEGSSGHECYNKLVELIDLQFPKDFKVNCYQLL
mmetsp:Transcript_18083/g.30860  ORF Transcript_18083/g.30860 Transcript_18083/m.30860 type:complete len:119 (+) Transcript_18083:189-545(+)